MASWRDKLYAAVGQTPPPEKIETVEAVEKVARNLGSLSAGGLGPIGGDGKLTDAQVENWRKALCLTLGPYALVMPRAQVQAMRDRLQEKVCEKA